MNKKTARGILMLLYTVAFIILGLWIIIFAVSDVDTCTTVLLYMVVSCIMKALDKGIKAINNNIKKEENGDE